MARQLPIEDFGKTKRVGIWIRVSTDMQVESESPEHHEKRGRFYAEAKSWQVVEVYRLEAQSGKSVMLHPETQRMIADIKRGHISGIIFSKLARLARNTKELLEFADLFRVHDADLISLHESIDTSTPAGRLFYTMIAAMAQWEREEIAERIAASVPIRAKLGKPLGGAAPFGYRWENRELVPDENEAPVRKLIYDLFLTHQRKKTVANLLNKAGHRTRNGSHFSDTTVDRLLRDTTAKGIRRANYTKSLGEKKHWVYKPKEEWIEIPIPAIVEREIWDQANAILDARHITRKRPARRAVQLFAGIVYCDCGTKMKVPSNNKKYICSSCHNKIGTVDLEEVFHHQLKDFFFSPQEIISFLKAADEAIQNKEDMLDTLRTEQSKIQAEMKKVYQLYVKDKISPDGFGQVYRPLENRLEEISSQLPDLQGEVDFLKIQQLSKDEIFTEFQSLYSGWKQLDQEAKRTIIEHSVERISVGSDQISIELGYLPSSSELMASRQHNNTDSSRRPE